MQITRLKVKGSVEERIFDMCAMKAATCASALGDSGGKSSGRQKMSLQHALALFGDENDSILVPDAPDAGDEEDVSSAAEDVGTLDAALGGLSLA